MPAMQTMQPVQRPNPMMRGMPQAMPYAGSQPTAGPMGSIERNGQMGGWQTQFNTEQQSPTMRWVANQGQTPTQSGFGDMTNGDMLRMLFAKELAADPTELGGAAAHQARAAQTLLGGEGGLFKAGVSAPQAGRYGVDLNAGMDPEMIRRAQYSVLSGGKNPNKYFNDDAFSDPMTSPMGSMSGGMGSGR